MVRILDLEPYVECQRCYRSVVVTLEKILTRPLLENSSNRQVDVLLPSSQDLQLSLSWKTQTTILTLTLGLATRRF